MSSASGQHESDRQCDNHHSEASSRGAQPQMACHVSLESQKCEDQRDFLVKKNSENLAKMSSGI
ncbi:hypothetical protein E2C01_081570 [Portunus trituberculatus]|uniref:Uncharacterized protein n=1 Tax=Portunus trituberculatus TaxID=210409 RepID=A0A5B7J2N7_PORTR|nr:hypothetical protein [Portunus trituberculatus]